MNRKNNSEETQSEHVHFEKYVTCPMHTMPSLHMYTVYIYLDRYIHVYIYIYIFFFPQAFRVGDAAYCT